MPGLFAIEIDAEPISGSRTAARVKVQYGTPELAAVPGAVQIRIGGSSGHKLLTQLPDGSLIVVKYTDPAGNALAGSFADSGSVGQYGSGNHPAGIWQPAEAVGEVSADGERVALAGGRGENVALPGDRRDQPGGLSRYEVRYVFEYDPDGWERLEYFVDRYTGKVPDDVKVTSSSMKRG